MLGSAGNGDVSCTSDQSLWLSNPTSREREAALRNLLWRGHLVLMLPTHLAATMHGQARRCLECVAGQKARAQTYANRHSLPNKIFMNAIAKLSPSKSPFGIKLEQFVRHITLGDLTVACKWIQP